MRAKVITAYVPLEVKHLTAEDYHAYADRLERALPPGKFRAFRPYPLGACWLHGYLSTNGWLDLPPATETPADRYATPAAHVASNVVQHNRTRWMCMAMDEDPGLDITIWLDYAVLKQGAWRGNQIKEEHIGPFVESVEKYFTDGGGDIPFPGINPPGPVEVHGNNFRFCGSTHIIPRWHLYYVDERYRKICRGWVENMKCIPLDLPIWALTEQSEPKLPFSFYQAEYDATQLTNFPVYNGTRSDPAV